MFGKKSNGPTILAKGDAIEGTLRAATSVHVDGRIDGNVEAEGTVSIGPEGAVHGEVHASDVAVAGRVEGRIVARGPLHLLASGVLEGDAAFQTIQVDRGGVVRGHMGGEPSEEQPEDLEPAYGSA